MPFTPIIGTLGYVLSADRTSVLLVHRSREGDEHAGKWNGLGGKLEAGEDVVACVRRELREEAGIEATSLRLRGTVSWPGFGAGGADWFGFIFVVEDFTGEAGVSRTSMALVSDGTGRKEEPVTDILGRHPRQITRHNA
ncbi:MAG TPA: NUDIX domain-containing protein, partial [Propionicimonas sp.]|nr:NUDIX domain-containing protein [Propionicimonas sp.]